MKNCIYAFIILVWASSCGDNPSKTPTEAKAPVVKREILNNEENKTKLGQVSEGESIPISYVKTRDNTLIDTKGFKNKPLIINLWATWCEPCLTDTPKFQEIAKAYPQANFISVSIDKDLNEWQSFLEEKNWLGQHYFIGRDEDNPLFPLVYTDIQNEDIQGVHIALPKYVLVSADGTIRKRNTASPQTTGFTEALDAFLN